jgi:hypothetical protein
MVAYHCSRCDKVFTALEGKQALIIIRLQEVIKDLTKQANNNHNHKHKPKAA